MKTFKELQDAALNWIDEVENQDVLRDNIKQAIDAAQHALLTSRKWPFMKWPAPITFATVTGEQDYALHPLFYRATRFWNNTDDHALIELTDSSLDRIRHDTAQFIELRGRQPVKQQPLEAETLVLTSSSGSDITQTLTVEGLDADDELVTETLTVTGGDSTESFKQILKVTKGETAFNGTLTLATSSGRELLKLRASEKGRSYQIIHFRDDPGVITVEYEFHRIPLRLSDDNDTPEVPPPFEDILTYKGLIDLAAYTKPEPDALGIWKMHYDELFNALLETYSEAHSKDRLASYMTFIPRD